MADHRIPIIYVHLGDLPAPHLIDFVQQSRRAAPDTSVFAVLSGNAAMGDGVVASGATVIRAESWNALPTMICSTAASVAGSARSAAFGASQQSGSSVSRSCASLA